MKVLNMSFFFAASMLLGCAGGSHKKNEKNHAEQNNLADPLPIAAGGVFECTMIAAHTRYSIMLVTDGAGTFDIRDCSAASYDACDFTDYTVRAKDLTCKFIDSEPFLTSCVSKIADSPDSFHLSKTVQMNITHFNGAKTEAINFRSEINSGAVLNTFEFGNSCRFLE